MRLHPLQLKLFRDLAKMKGQVVAVSVVFACGLGMMIMMKSLIFSLETTRNAYYEGNRFGDVFCEAKRAPNFLRQRLGEIANVSAVETRVTGKLTLDLPGLAEPADGALISLPDDRPLQLHQLFLRRGRMPNPGTRGEVVVGEAFAEMNYLAPGDHLSAIIRGARQTLTVVGIALSPEYIFEARAGETLPDNKRFGVFWMSERELSGALDLKGAFNSVILDVAPGADQAQVRLEVDQLLAPYGGRIAYERKDHPSARRLDDEIQILKGLAVAFPAVFLSIAAFMVSAVLTRVVRLQREQIAQLKAFGYSSYQVGWHYLQFAFVIVCLGTALGGSVGIWLGDQVVLIYHQFFRFPNLTFRLDHQALGWALFASTGAAALGVTGAVRQAVRLPPAEAMRPEAPASYRISLVERLGLQRFFPTSLRMALRNLERNPWQSFFTALGLALATAIPLVPGAMRDGISYLLDFEWSQAAREDANVVLIEPSGPNALSDLRHLPGVLTAEPFREVAAQLRFGHRTRRLGVSGVPTQGTLHRQLDITARPIVMPLNGVVLSEKLAETLSAQLGDTITLEILEGRRPKLTAVIQGLVTDYAGVAAYMDLGTLQQLMHEGDTLNGAHLAVDQAHWAEFLGRVKECPRVAALTIKAATRESFRKSTGEMIGKIQTLYFGFSVVIAFGVVYNSARIALAERSRDLATLRVIGFTGREVAMVLIGELSLLTLVALPLGLLIGTGMATSIIHSVSTEAVRLPLVLTARSYATAVLIVSVSASFSFYIVSRRVRDLDLLSVLKARD